MQGIHNTWRYFCPGVMPSILASTIRASLRQCQAKPALKKRGVSKGSVPRQQIPVHNRRLWRHALLPIGQWSRSTIPQSPSQTGGGNEAPPPYIPRIPRHYRIEGFKGLLNWAPTVSASIGPLIAEGIIFAHPKPLPTSLKATHR